MTILLLSELWLQSASTLPNELAIIAVVDKIPQTLLLSVLGFVKVFPTRMPAGHIVGSSSTHVHSRKTQNPLDMGVARISEEARNPTNEATIRPPIATSCCRRPGHSDAAARRTGPGFRSAAFDYPFTQAGDSCATSYDCCGGIAEQRVTGFIDDLHQDCGQTADWTKQGVQELATVLPRSVDFTSVHPSRDDMSVAFIAAVRSRDVPKAIEIGKLSGNWPALAMGVIEQLDEAWQEDTLSIGDIAECYWTLRRALDELAACPSTTSQKSLSIGTAVIYIPSSEQHTFGPQMLVDKINRLGWDAQLWHGFGSGSLMERLSSKHVDVLGISVGTDDRLDGLADLIADARQYSINPGIKTLIGGTAICGASSQYGFLGADWVSTTADDTRRFFEQSWSELKRREGGFNG